MHRIVVIEDDPVLLRGLKDNLRLESYDVLTAIDGEDGYRLVHEKQPDLVILDLTLPRLDGYEVCERMRRNGLATPILLLTAQSEEMNRIRGFEVGADDYVTKPFSLRELLGRVRAILKRSEARSDLAMQIGLEEARKVQEQLLPTHESRLNGLRVCGMCRPVRIVGGDFFDVLKFEDGSVGICIADVCGKGMPAALMMACLQATLKAYASRKMGPGDLCANLNEAMCNGAPTQTLVSFFYAVFTSDRKRLIYCNAGHNPPILSGSLGISRLEDGGAILGAFRDSKYEDREIALRAGDRIVMYTDGVTECRDAADQFFGEHRLIDFVDRFDNPDPFGLLQALIATVSEFSHGRFDDDLTVVSISVCVPES